MKSKKISVIVPVYNVGKYLKRCVDSILDQTYSDLEVILIDDGSTDESPQICDEYNERDDRIIVIHKQNQGAGAARNTAMEVATGDYFAFVDADDYLDASAYEKMIRRAENDDSDLVIGGASFIDFKGNVRKTNMNPFYPAADVFKKEGIRDVVLNMLELYRETSIESSFPIDMALWKSLFRASIVRDNNLSFYSEREYKSEDFIFYLEYVPRCSTVSFINECLYYHCDNVDSISHNYNVHTQDKNDRMVNKMLEILSDLNLLDEYKKGVEKVYLEATLIVLFDIYRNDKYISYKKAKECMEYVCNGKEFRKHLAYISAFSRDYRDFLFLKMMKNRFYSVIHLFSKAYMFIKG